MSNEFAMEVFFIKIKIKGYLKNITENTENSIDTNGIKNKKNIIYIENDIKHKIIINNDNIILLRENDEFIHSIQFKLNKENLSEYFIKELNTSINILIKTTKLELTENKIEIEYQNVDNQNKYLYIIEMSDK